MTYSDFGNELLEVEQQKWWDPTNYDSQALPMTQALNAFVLSQAVAVMVCNAVVVWVAFRARFQLLSNAANIFSVSLSINNVIYGAYLTGMRAYLLLVAYEWTETSCALFAAINVYFIINCVFHLMMVCFERYLSLVLLVRIRAKHAMWVTLCAPLPCAVYTGLHFLSPGRGIISRSGLFCSPTSFTNWIGALDITLLICCITAVLGGYALVFLQLHRVSRASATAIVFPNIGKATMLALGQSGPVPVAAKAQEQSAGLMYAHLRSLLLSLATSLNLPQLMHMIASARRTTLGHFRLSRAASAASSSTPHASNSVIAAPNVLDAVTEATDPSIANLATQRASDSRVAEKRLVKRALFTFCAYSFIYPWCYFIYLGHKYGRRPTVQEDYWICAVKLFAEICDPIILVMLDRRFNAELKALFGKKSDNQTNC
ncbi:hypothetical protein BCR44DRAFT_47297 [Catenaria anguillulae PL171]|uniref:G-protein coupled receptors family 1 profile domain-containing protein n=1 Tax=Catenaria anguillulae PL171 TaxID=765915 RepID=A0A1Y2HN70_9FUNG|nr:hypothetical protein BCR44DRAFT_47297 [Catenaria anguillulae PL171]